MKTFINSWIKENQYSESELKLMDTERINEKDILSDKEYLELESNWFKLLPYSNLNIDNSTVTVDECETNIIDKLFSSYVDSDTLVISSNREHPSVTNNLDKCVNKIILDYDNEILKLNYSRLSDINKFKKVLVLIVGTHVATGQITPQTFFINLKKYLDSKNVEYKMVLDDAQGIFLVHRDYSLFDYVFGTAHATIERYNMGICISTGVNIPLGEKVYNWLNSHLLRIDILNKRLYKLSMFKNMMTDYYYERILKNNNFSLYNNALNSPNIFSIVDKNKLFNASGIYEMLADNHLELDGIRDGEVNYIRFRGQYFVGDDRLYKSIDTVDKILSLFE